MHDTRSEIESILRPHIERMRVLEAYFHIAQAYRVLWERYIDSGDENLLEILSRFSTVLHELEKLIGSQNAHAIN